MTFVYSDSTAVVGPLAIANEPHSWDLCVGHASRITAPRGWQLVRHAGALVAPPEDDDLVALANAVREGSREGGDRIALRPPVNGFSNPVCHTDGAPAAVSGNAFSGNSALAPATHRPGSTGRRRGHLRVLPDPPT